MKHPVGYNADARLRWTEWLPWVLAIVVFLRKNDRTLTRMDETMIGVGRRVKSVEQDIRDLRSSDGELFRTLREHDQHDSERFAELRNLIQHGKPAAANAAMMNS